MLGAENVRRRACQAHRVAPVQSLLGSKRYGNVVATAIGARLYANGPPSGRPLRTDACEGS